jgi:hypothetical protein
MLKVVLMVMLTGTTAWLLKTYSGLTWPVTITLTLSGGLLYAFVLKLLDIKEMIAVLRGKE